MKISSFLPHPSLQPYIEAYSIMERGEDEIITDHYPMYKTFMCFDITQKHLGIIGLPDFDFSLGFSGVCDRHLALKSTPQKLLQVVFKPHGAYRFFNMNMAGLVNNGTDVQLLLPDMKDVVAKMEELYPQELKCMEVLETYFLQRIKKREKYIKNLDQIAFACAEIKRFMGDIKIKELCHKVNMSETRFRLHFAEKIGISAKSFCQIEKMNRVESILQQDKMIDWKELCEKLNYYDQNHFIKSFKAHFGCTPKQFLRK